MADYPTVTTTSSPWLVPVVSVVRPQLRLFCFLNAGGSSAMLRSWPGVLPPVVEICAVQLPGQGSRFREQPFTRITPLIEALLPVLTPYLDLPFVFWGYSMGSLVAFELARALGRDQVFPQHLFVAARRAPQVATRETPLHPLTEAAFIREVQRRYNGIPASVLREPDLLALFLPVLRANLEMIETHVYEAGAPLPCPISAFGGLHDPTVSAEGIMAWGQQTSASFKYFMYPGDHFFWQQQQADVLQTMANDLRALLPPNV
ncbi:MAG TPA: alpha/beta fold hydrolase [Phototrophicaceae bacterium]|nr:alpha/beta fold hydrolase [Phototrophicaceae bacterium]